MQLTDGTASGVLLVPVGCCIVALYLIHSWPDLCTRHKTFDLLRAENADTYALDQTLLNTFLQSLPPIIEHCKLINISAVAEGRQLGLPSGQLKSQYSS